MNRSEKARKQEVSEKIREIKLRQQNWMKQREKSNQGEEIKPNKPTQGELQHKPSSSQKAVAKQPRNSSFSAETKDKSTVSSIIASKKSKARFHNWMKAKETHEQSSAEDHSGNKGDNSYDSRNYHDDLYRSNHYSDQPYRDHKGSSDVNVLRVPSSRSPEYATPEPDWNSEDETGEITAAGLMSPSDFETVADNIIAKVKGNMGMKSQGTQDKKYSSSNQYSYHATEHREKLASNESTEMASHICPGCNKLMVPPSHVPMLIIPCGHSVCGHCAVHGKYCSMCGCPIQSSTANIMLQHIISEYQSKTSQRKSIQIDEGRRSNKLKYHEEYQNLLTRKEILQEECGEISQTIHKITSHLKTEEQQVAGIKQEEKNIHKQIAVLQDKLEALVGHRRQYESTCHDLEQKTKSEQNRLSLVKQTLSSLHSQIEKIKLLAEDDE